MSSLKTENQWEIGPIVFTVKRGRKTWLTARLRPGVAETSGPFPADVSDLELKRHAYRHALAVGNNIAAAAELFKHEYQKAL